MSEITYRIIKYDGFRWVGHSGEITEYELKRRLAYVAGWPIEEMGSMEREIEVLVHGDGDLPPKEMRAEPYYKKLGEGENQHDLPGCEDEAGPNWKGEREKGEVKSNLLVCDYCGKRFPESQFYDDRCIDCCRDLVKNDQPSPAPVQEGPLYTNRDPEPTQPTLAPTREEWRIWIQDLPRPSVLSWNDVDIWLDKVEIWLEHGPWMPKE